MLEDLEQSPEGVTDPVPELTDYLRYLAGIDPDGLDRSEALAYWVNTYNVGALLLAGGAAVADRATDTLRLSLVFLWYGGVVARPHRMPSILPESPRLVETALVPSLPGGVGSLGHQIAPCRGVPALSLAIALPGRVSR